MVSLKKDELDFLTRFIIESDSIEGIDNDFGTLTAQLEHEHPFGHAGALVMLHRAASMHLWGLSEAMVLSTQEMIVREQPSKGERALPERLIGRWRDCEIRVGGRAGEAARFVPTVMRHLIEEARQWQLQLVDPSLLQDRIRFIARWHWQYELTHPFGDGNGRSGRALVYYLYRYAGLEPFVFTHIGKRENYYPCFNQSSPAMMEQYFLDRSPATR